MLKTVLSLLALSPLALVSITSCKKKKDPFVYQPPTLSAQASEDQKVYGSGSYFMLNGKLYVGATNGGIGGPLFVTSDWGITWNPVEPKLENAWVDKMSAFDKQIFMIVSDSVKHQKLLYTSGDAGVTWKNAPITEKTFPCLEKSNFQISAVESGFICSDYFSKNGTEFFRVKYNTSTTQAPTVLGDTIFSSKDMFLYSTKDSGATWESKFFPFKSSPQISVGGTRIDKMVALEGTLYLQTSAGVFTTKDKGVTYEKIADGPEAPSEFSVFNKGELLYWIVNKYVDSKRSQDHIFLDTKTNKISKLTTENESEYVRFSYSEGKLAAFASRGQETGSFVDYSEDNGVTWFRVQKGEKKPSPLKLEQYSNTKTDNGIWDAKITAEFLKNVAAPTIEFFKASGTNSSSNTDQGKKNTSLVIQSTVPAITGTVDYKTNTLNVKFNSKLKSSTVSKSSIMLRCIKNQAMQFEVALSAEDTATLSFKRLPSSDSCMIQIVGLQNSDGGGYNHPPSEFSTSANLDAVPKGLKTISGKKTFKITWEAVPGASSYSLMWAGVGRPPTWRRDIPGTCLVLDTEDIKNYLESEGAFKFQAASVDEYGESGWSDGSSVVYESGPEILTCP